MYSLPDLGHARQPCSQGLSSLLETRWELVSGNLGDQLRAAVSYHIQIISFLSSIFLQIIQIPIYILVNLWIALFGLCP